MISRPPSDWESYANELVKLQVYISRKELAEIANRFQESGGRDDRDFLVRSAILWGVKLAHRYARAYNAHYVFPDLLQEAMIGLIIATKKYTPQLGTFTNWATWSIRRQIVTFLINHLETVRLPVNRHVKLSQLRRLAAELENKLERRPSDEEIVAAGFDAEILEDLRETPFSGVISLDKPIGNEGDGGDITLKDVIPDDGGVERFLESIRSESLRSAILEAARQCLKPREVKILSLRFGLNGGEGMMLESIGECLGITRERVRQILKKITARPRFRLLVIKTCRTATEASHAKVNQRTLPEKPALPVEVSIETLREETRNGGKGAVKGTVRCPVCEARQPALPEKCRRCGVRFVLKAKPGPENTSHYPEPAALTICQEDNASRVEKENNASRVEKIGKRIKILRLASGMTQGELQKRSGVSRSYLSRIESGQMTPSLATLEKIGEVLGIDMRDFFKEDLPTQVLFLDPFLSKLRPLLPGLNSAKRAEILLHLSKITAITK